MKIRSALDWNLKSKLFVTMYNQHLFPHSTLQRIIAYMRKELHRIHCVHTYIHIIWYLLWKISTFLEFKIEASIYCHTILYMHICILYMGSHRARKLSVSPSFWRRYNCGNKCACFADTANNRERRSRRRSAERN